MNLPLRLVLLTSLLAGCASAPARVNAPLGGPPPSGASVQALYESGRDDEVVSRTASPSVGSEDVWFGAQSLLRVGQQAGAQEQFRRLRDSAQSDAFRRAAEVALARVGNQADAGEVARAAVAAFPGDPFVQFEAGVTLALQGDMAGAAAAFDTALNASPMMAYAYYQSGLAYNRLNRPDLTIARFESFVRLAPAAPERAQVESVLRTARGGQ
jgi:tetratricopeptide (TPR) repeat protein